MLVCAGPDADVSTRRPVPFGLIETSVRCPRIARRVFPFGDQDTEKNLAEFRRVMFVLCVPFRTKRSEAANPCPLLLYVTRYHASRVPTGA